MTEPAPKIQILDHRGRPIASGGIGGDTAHFAASRMAREMRAWMPALESATSELHGERSTMAARALDLERNDGIAGGVIQTYADNIVGIGLRLSPQPNYAALGRTKEWADAWSRNTSAQWRTFANSLDFDAGRSLTFGAHSVMMLRAAMLEGDGLAVGMWLGPDDRPGARWSTCIMGVDAARLGTPPGMMEGQGIHDGVEVNTKTGEPIAYHIRKSFPGDFYTPGTSDEFERVPARTAWGRRRVIHLFDRGRYGQQRGKTVLANVMGAFKMLQHYQRTELQSVIINSMIAAFIETPLPPEQIAELFGTPEKLNASRADWDVKLEGASVIPLHPGDKLAPFMPSRPNSAYESFVNAVLRYISAGVNMPYELLMKDFSQTNYSSARAALLEAWRFFMAKREWLAVYWATPVYEMWLEEAIARGLVEDPGYYENREAVSACQWIGPGRGWVDPGKEADAAATRMDNNLSTLQRECAEQGLDWEEVLEQRAAEQRYAASLGVTLAQGPATNAPYASDAEMAGTGQQDGQQDGAATIDVDRFKGLVDAYGNGVRAGVVTPQADDERFMRSAAGLPPPSDAIAQAWKDEPVRRPITLAKPGDLTPPDPAAAQAPDPNGQPETPPA